MKKVIIGIVVVAIVVVAIFACSKLKTNDTNNTNTGSSQETSKKFEDLTDTQRVGVFDDVWVDLPDWRLESRRETSITIENVNYFIVMAISKENYSFDELYNNEMKKALKNSVNRGTYQDFTPDAKEEVELSNGIKATKFEGTVVMDNYGTIYKYPTYGYYFKYNNYPVMIMSIETEKGGASKNSEEQRTTANKYVDEIVQTIRSTEN